MLEAQSLCASYVEKQGVQEGHEESIGRKRMKKLVFLVLLMGCVALPRGERKEKVKNVPIIVLHSDRGQGSGVPIGRLTLLTVEHVADVADKMTVDGRTFSVHKQHVINRPGMREPLVVMGHTGRSFKEWYEIGDGDPHVVVTPRGRFQFKGYEPVPGDSGSPVLDKEGKLVALISGLTEYLKIAIGTFRKPVVVRVVPLPK